MPSPTLVRNSPSPQYLESTQAPFAQTFNTAPREAVALTPVCRALLAPFNFSRQPAVVPARLSSSPSFCASAPTVVFVHEVTPAVSLWLAQLRAGLELDTSINGRDVQDTSTFLVATESSKVEALVVPLGGSFGMPTSAADTAYFEKTYLALVLSSDRQSAIGYCSFFLKWRATPKDAFVEDVSLEALISEVWLLPTRRGKSISRLLSGAVSDVAYASACLLEEGCCWLPGTSAEVVIRVSGEVVSLSGEEFLRRCTAEFKDIFKDWNDAAKLQISRVVWNPIFEDSHLL